MTFLCSKWNASCWPLPRWACWQCCPSCVQTCWTYAPKSVTMVSALWLYRISGALLYPDIWFHMPNIRYPAKSVSGTTLLRTGNHRKPNSNNNTSPLSFLCFVPEPSIFRKIANGKINGKVFQIFADFIDSIKYASTFFRLILTSFYE